ncbi:cell division protein FtsL [Marininema mesophilum]|uniref:Cell division protein FtsL n=1 Tax=Marininema mesophilum TaxID=1048340 RepID=A0A1H2QGP2_9BACL|nr:cell division protein FtsL [Marininema mesophilum]SDW05784.1 cell division protein FtsL [Marininema mesophilum]
MREYRGNASTAFQLESRPKKADQRERQPRKPGFPVGEKLLYLFSVVICVALALLVLSRYAAATELSMKLSKVEQEASQSQETIQELESQQKELKSGERIRRYAEDRGMVLQEKNSLGPSSSVESSR